MGPVPVMRGLLAQPRATVQVEVVETGGRPSRLTASCARDPTASRPPHHDRTARHRDPYAVSFRFGKASDTFCYNLRRWLWAPARASLGRDDTENYFTTP